MTEMNAILLKQAKFQLAEERRIQASAAWKLQINTVRSIIKQAMSYSDQCSTNTNDNMKWKSQVTILEANNKNLKERAANNNANLSTLMLK